MVAEQSDEGEDRSPTDVERLVRRLDAHRSLPAVGHTRIPVLGPPSAVADESRAAHSTSPDVVVSAAQIYVTLEVRGVSQETLEVTSTDTRLTIHALGADGRVFHREIDLTHPVEPEAVTATYRNGVLDVILPRRTGHKVRIRKEGPDG